MFSLPRQFSPESLELAYQADHCRRFAVQRRAVLFLGALIWLAFIGWDLAHARHQAQVAQALPSLIGLRLLGFALLVGIGLATFQPWFEQQEGRASALMVAGNVGIALVALLMMHQVPLDHALQYYCYGLLVSMVFAFGVLRLRAVTLYGLMAAYCVGGTGLLLLLVQFSTESAAAWAWVAAWKLSTMLLTFSIIGTAFGNQLERTQRASFLRESELARYNQAITAHSREVEFLNASIRYSSDVAEERHLALLALKDQMREEAERRNQEKSQFLANAVHDLKQPLQAIGNVLEPALQRLGEGDTAQVASMLGLAQTATTRMRNLLNSILEMSRLESGFLRAELSHFDMLALLREVLAQLADTARHDGVELRLQAGGLSNALVCSDRHFMMRILLNLIGNGIKYRQPERPGAWVKVTLSLDDGALRLAVEDNGVGMAPKYLERGDVFRPFFQIGPGRGGGETGVGLGLSIVSSMLALLPGHTLQASSTPGQGTCMQLTLPQGEAARLVAVPADAPAQNGQSLQGVYLLLVEDDDLVRRATGSLLSAQGVLYESLSSVEELAELLPHIERQPDLILTDLRLPGGRSAHDVIQLVSQELGTVACVVFTGEKVGPQELARLQGCEVLLKPLAASLLLAAIGRAAGRSRPGAAPEDPGG